MQWPGPSGDIGALRSGESPSTIEGSADRQPGWFGYWSMREQVSEELHPDPEPEKLEEQNYHLLTDIGKLNEVKVLERNIGSSVLDMLTLKYLFLLSLLSLRVAQVLSGSAAPTFQLSSLKLLSVWTKDFLRLRTLTKNYSEIHVYIQ